MNDRKCGLRSIRKMESEYRGRGRDKCESIVGICDPCYRYKIKYRIKLS